MRYDPPPPCAILAPATAGAAAAPDNSDAEMTLLAYRLADRLVVADIECEAVRIRPDADRLWDVRHMLDPREACDESIDMVRQAIAYGIWRGLIEVVQWHDAETWTPALVRITRNPS